MAADETSGTRPAPVVLRIKLRYDDVDAMVQRFAANVGKSGIFLPTKSIQPIGSEIKFELRLVDDQVVIVGLGRVRAARAPDPADPKAVFGIAVELLRVTRESRALILRMLERRRQLGLGEIGMPMPEDVDAARRADVDTAVKDAVPQPVPAETASGGDSSLLTAPRRPTGPIGVAKEYAVQPLAPEPAKRPRPRISELIATTRSGPLTAVALPELEEAIDVASAIARAKALTSGDLDKELESILDQAAAPREIGIEAASAELARQLGGKPVARRERSAPSARWAPPPSVANDPDAEGVVIGAPLQDLSGPSPPTDVEASVAVAPEPVAAPASVVETAAPVPVEPVVEAPADAVEPITESEPVVAAPIVADEPVVAREPLAVEPSAPVARRSVPRLLTPESAFASEVAGAVDAIVATTETAEPKRRSAPKVAKVVPTRLASEPRLFRGAEDEVDEALSQLRAVTSDPVPGEPVRETEPFGRVEAGAVDATLDDGDRGGTLDRIVDELEMDDADRTNVGAMIPDPTAFDHHAYATEPAVPHDLADADLAAGLQTATPPPDDEEFEIEEISDFEIIAEADEEDADLLAADGERDAGHVETDQGAEEVSDFSIPFRPSQDFASRLDLGDDDDIAPHHIGVGEQSSRHDLSAFDRSDVHEIGVGEDSAVSYIGEGPNERSPYDPISQSYTETSDPPAEESLEFDAPHSFSRKRSHDHELETALEDLEPDLDELAPPYAGAGDVAGGRERVATGRNRSLASTTPPKPTPAPAEPAGRQHPRAGTEDGILIDFDDDD